MKEILNKGYMFGIGLEDILESGVVFFFVVENFVWFFYEEIFILILFLLFM